MIHKHLPFLVCCALSLSVSLSAQTKEFTVAAMNVDGMPKSVKVALVYDLTLNPDAKEAPGAIAIGQKLKDKQYDLIGVSEDFNYNSQIMDQISSVYSAGTHRGGISVNASTYFNYAAKKTLFDTDGLNFFWRTNTVGVSCESWTAWWDHYGYTDDGADGLIKKGFRYYLADFGDDVLVDIYILHMDAEVSDGDIAARESQMRQLVDDILRINPSRRPKIVMGDTNCRYTRDHLKTLFIDAINADGRYTIKDGWVEKCKSNTYPTYGSDALMTWEYGYEQGEIVDKLFYINPKMGLQLTLNRFYVDTDFNNEEGEPLADHYPVVGEFQAKGTLYDPASYWSGGYDNDAYRTYAQAYDGLLPLIKASLKSPLKEELTELLTAHVDANSDIMARITTFRQHLEAYMSEKYTETDYTHKITNPSFEQGQRLATGNVEGWTVATDVTEAFISGIKDNDEGAAIRYFAPHDGDYVFNTWGGNPANGFFCLQDVSLTSGWYRLEGVVTTDGNRSVSLRFGDARVSSGPRADRAEGARLSIITYHTGGKITIGAESNDWFETDDFRLYRLKAIPTAIHNIPVDESLEESPLPNRGGVGEGASTIYTPDGRTLAQPRRGINIIRQADGTTHKILVK